MIRKKILIIDDETGFTEMLRLNLEGTGNYAVRVENSPTKAIEAALDFDPDLILLDVIMPNIEGPDVAHEIRSSDLLRDIPVVFLTATVTKGEVDAQNGRIGGHPFVAKPSTLPVLMHVIEQNLRPRH